MFSFPHRSLFDAELEELPHRIKTIKEKNIELHKSLMQSFKDDNCTEKLRKSYFWDEEEARAVEMCHTKVLELARTYKKTSLKLNLDCALEDNAINNNLSMKSCSLASSYKALEIPLISKVNSCFKDSSSEKKTKLDNFSNNQNEEEVVEIIGDSDTLTLPMKNDIEQGKQNLRSCSTVETRISTLSDKCKPQFASRNVNLPLNEDMKSKHDGNFENFDQDVIFISDINLSSNDENKNYKPLLKKNRVEEDKRISLDNKECKKLKSKQDTNLDQDVIYLHETNLASYIKETDDKLLTDKSKVKRDKSNNINKDNKECKKLKSKQYTNLDQDVIYLRETNLASYIKETDDKLLTDKSKVKRDKSNNINKDNKECKKLKPKKNTNFNQDVIYLSDIKSSSNTEKNDDTMLTNKSTVQNDEINNTYKDNKECKKLKSKQDSIFEQDVIYLDDVNLLSNVEKKKEKLIDNTRRLKSNCQSEDDKNSKQKYAELDASNEVLVISDDLNIKKKAVNKYCHTSSIHNSSEIFTISDDSDNEINRDLTIVQNFENLVSDIDMEGFQEVDDYNSEVQIFKKILENNAEYIVPHLNLEEEPVDFPVPFLHTQGTVSFPSEKIKEFKSQGIFIKNGPFTEKEETLLRRNLRDFQSQFKIYNARLLLGIGRQLPLFSSEFGQIRKFLRAKHFYERLGKDINNRTLHCIYNKARSQFSPFKKKLSKRSATADEVQQILQLQKKYGNKWMLIGQILGLNPFVCSGVYSYYNEPFELGKWSEKEIEYLISAIKSVVKSSESIEDNVLKGKWVKIAKLVPSRNYKQCYSFWKRNLKELKERFF